MKNFSTPDADRSANRVRALLDFSCKPYEANDRSKVS